MTPLHRTPTVLSATLLLTASLCFGATRDFGAFLLSLLLLPALFAAAVFCAVIYARTNRSPARLVLGASLLALSPAAWLAAYTLADPVTVAAWALTHPARFRAATRADGVVTHWQAWGIAGMANDSYLVADPADDLRSLPTANRWRTRNALPCDIVATRRVWPRLYLVTTYNCTF